jgi:hypothetical protein
MTTYSLVNTCTLGTTVARGGNNTKLSNTEFNAAINASSRNTTNGQKTAFIPAILAWAGANSGWLVPAVVTAIGAIGTALTWDKTIKFIQDLCSGNLENSTFEQRYEASAAILKDPRSKDMPIEVRKALEANVMMAIGKPRRVLGRRDKSNHSLVGGKRPNYAKPPKNDEPKIGWVQNVLNYTQLRSLPRGLGMKRYGSSALYQKAIGQGNTVKIFQSLFSKVEKSMHRLNQSDLSIFNKIKIQMNPYLDNPTQNTMSRLISHNDLKNIIVTLRNICKNYALN